MFKAVFINKWPRPTTKGSDAIMIEVDVRGDLEYAIRQLKKKLQIDGIKRELKRREYYEKPSVKKRRKAAEALRKLRKFNRMRSRI